MKRAAGAKSCFAVHSFAAALRWPRLPRKFRGSKRLPNREILLCGWLSRKVRIVSHERSSRQRFRPTPSRSSGRYRRRDAAADGGAGGVGKRGRAAARGRPRRERAGDPDSGARRRSLAACRRTRRIAGEVAPAGARQSRDRRTAGCGDRHHPRRARCRREAHEPYQRHHQRPAIPDGLRGGAGGAAAEARREPGDRGSRVCAASSARSAMRA